MAAPETSVSLSATELGAWRGMLRVHTALVKALDAELAEAHDLPLSSYEVLITLESAPNRKRRMAELADSVLLSRSGMTRLVDRLEQHGLLIRDTCTDDGRGCYAVLTDKGAEGVAEGPPAPPRGGGRAAGGGPPDTPRGCARALPHALLRGRAADVRARLGARAAGRRRDRLIM